MSAPKPEDLPREARQRYDTWRSLGLTESAAMQALRDEGILQESAHDRAVEAYRAIGLSEAAAEIAAVGRDGRRPVSEQSGGGELGANADALKRKVTELAETYMRQGELESPAYGRAARRVLNACKSGQLLWTVTNILEGWRPGVTGLASSTTVVSRRTAPHPQSVKEQAGSRQRGVTGD